MNDVIASSAVTVLSLLVVLTATTLSRRRDDARYLVAAFAMHVVFAIALRFMMESFFGVSDVRMYLTTQLSLRPLLDVHPARGVIEIAKLIVQLPNEISPEPRSTDSMIGVAALGMWSLNDSSYALFLACATFGFFGKWGIYAALRDELEGTSFRLRSLAISTLMIPSCVYWTAGLVKECFAVGGLGALTRGVQLLMRDLRNVWALPLVVFGGAIVGAFKPFFLFAFVIAVGAWLFFTHVKKVPRLAPLILAIAVAFALVGLSLLGSRYDSFATDRVGDSVASMQELAQEAGGGSSYSLGDPTRRSVAGQVAFAPLALLTVIMRPFPFEVRNVQAAVAAVELVVLNFFLFRSLYRTGFRTAWRNVLRRPVIIFALTFTVSAGIGVGLATGNFGTLSRYRTPVLPFYAVVVLIGLAEDGAKRAVHSPAARLLPAHVLARRRGEREGRRRGPASG